MTWVAVAVGAGSVIGGVASNAAAKKQADAGQKSIDAQQSMFNTLNSQQTPYREGGQQALHQLQYLTGTIAKPTAPNKADYMSTRDGGRGKFYDMADPAHKFAMNTLPGLGGKKKKQEDQFNSAGYNAAMAKYNEDIKNFSPGLSADDPNSLMHKFGAGDLNANLAPNWDFSLKQGQGAVQNMANLSGGLLSGNTLKGISDYTINKSGDLYQKAFENYNANQTNIFNRLSSIAGLGQTANAQTASFGVPIANTIGNTYQGIGQAQASGIVGASNAVNSGISNNASWYQVKNMLNNNNANNGAGNDAGLYGEP
jgi:hypothetical protein